MKEISHVPLNCFLPWSMHKSVGIPSKQVWNHFTWLYGDLTNLMVLLGRLCTLHSGESYCMASSGAVIHYMTTFSGGWPSAAISFNFNWYHYIPGTHLGVCTWCTRAHVYTHACIYISTHARTHARMHARVMEKSKVYSIPWGDTHDTCTA